VREKLKFFRDRIRLLVVAIMIAIFLIFSMYFDDLLDLHKRVFVSALNVLIFVAFYVILKEIPTLYRSYSRLNSRYFRVCAAVNSAVLVVLFFNTDLKELSTIIKIVLALIEIVLWLKVISFISHQKTRKKI